MIDILLAIVIIAMGSAVLKITCSSKNKDKQYTFIYCPKCRNELVKNGQFIEDNDGIVKYKCSKCGWVSIWDFASCPAPILRTCEYCKHLSRDKFGVPHCEIEACGDCGPITQQMFKPK